MLYKSKRLAIRDKPNYIIQIYSFQSIICTNVTTFILEIQFYRCVTLHYKLLKN